MAMDPKQAVAMRESLLMKLQSEHAATKKVIEHVPDDKLRYELHEKVRDFAALSAHIYDTGMWFGAIMQKGSTEIDMGEEKPKVPSTKPALLDYANQLNEQFIGQVKQLSPEQLTKDVEFYKFGTFPAIMFLDWHISHLIHHRGQLTAYLRTMGAKVPAIYGDSLDYPM